MARGKVPTITDESERLETTIMDMMDVKRGQAYDLDILLGAVTKLPFSTEVIFDKIFGRWIFTNTHEDVWSKVMSGHKTAGTGFVFVSDRPEQAIIRGIHYYYHSRIKQ